MYWKKFGWLVATAWPVTLTGPLGIYRGQILKALVQSDMENGFPVEAVNRGATLHPPRTRPFHFRVEDWNEGLCQMALPTHRCRRSNAASPRSRDGLKGSRNPSRNGTSLGYSGRVVLKLSMAWAQV